MLHSMPEESLKYIPFARKYRSTNFKELLGQEVLVKTLSYCIANNRLASAYLLTGIRGVGKTSSARIIAKTVNCTELKVSGEEIAPCEQCTNCTSCANQSHPDIIEIDAASRTGVDDIREIIESSEYKPLLGAYKFFIIDEIHMLSKSAFNALLKVIEEPPPHVIFIFATTEVQKIPLTVISRCQRYDLRRLSYEEIQVLLGQIAGKENIKFEEEALKIIANKSEGSARDAVSMLDQAASYLHRQSDARVITAELIGRMLGLLQSNIIIEFTQLIIANDPSKAIALLNEIYAEANSLEYFVQAIADFMAELCKSKVIPNYHNPLYQNYSNELSSILIGTPLSRITILWQIFSNGLLEIKQSHNELITAQMLIIKAIHACNLPLVEDIMNPDKIISLGSEKHENDVFDFLKFCHGQKEMEIYYLLLNEVEVSNFKDLKLEIICNNKDINTQSKKIEKLLNDWSGNQWNVSSEIRQDVVTLKDMMLEKVRLSEDYQIIKNHFPDANISDIILKTKI
jgi:DNA polymerase-3 subunit gamma/tau